MSSVNMYKVQEALSVDNVLHVTELVSLINDFIVESLFSNS